MGSTHAPPAGTTGLAYDDLLGFPMPEEAGGARYELLDGELLVTPAPVTRHQDCVLQIGAALLAHSRSHGGRVFVAPFDVWFSDDTVFEPDVVAVVAGHRNRVDDRRLVGPPDLVVEVSSPSTRRMDLVRKRRVYERERVPEFWFVDLDADQVHLYRPNDGTYGPPEVVLAGSTIRSSALADFAIASDDALAIERA